jgi:outer membrane protein TolC
LSYYQVQLQNQLIENQLKLWKLSNTQELYYTQKYQQGLITTPEWKTYQSFSLEDSINLFNLESNQIKYLSDIQKLTGTQNIKVKKGNLPELPSYLDEKEWLSKLKNNPNLKLAFINEEIKANEIKLALANQYPAVTGNAGINYQRSYFDVENRGKGVGTSLDYYIGFAINFNLFNGFKSKTQTDIARIQSEIQNLKTDQLEQKIGLELEQYLKNYAQFYKQYEMSKKLSEIAESTLNYWTEKQKSGLITSLELRNYQKNVLLYQNQSNQSWYKCFQQWIEIQSICGIVEE